jgi:4-hydroxy-tetrahydrodipicolinate synthase
MADTPPAPFGRVLTAILTPFTDDGSVDYATFWKLIRHLASNGSNGIVVAGTTGESPTLTRAEKLALFKAAVDAAKGSMSVIACVGTYDTRESMELASAAATSGVDGFLERHGKEITDGKPAGIKPCAAKLDIALEIDANLFLPQGTRLLLVLLR